MKMTSGSAGQKAQRWRSAGPKFQASVAPNRQQRSDSVPLQLRVPPSSEMLLVLFSCCCVK